MRSLESVREWPVLLCHTHVSGIIIQNQTLPWTRVTRATPLFRNMSGLEFIPIVGVGLLGANVVLSHVSRLRRWIYVLLFLQDNYVEIDNKRDAMGWAQLCYEVHLHCVRHELRGPRQTIHMKVPRRGPAPEIDSRLIFPANGCFVVVPDRGVEIEVLPTAFRIFSKRFNPDDACDRFLALMGTAVDPRCPMGHTLPPLQGLMVRATPPPVPEKEEGVPMLAIAHDVL